MAQQETKEHAGFITQLEANLLLPVSTRTRQRMQQRGEYPAPALRMGNRLLYSRQEFMEALKRLAERPRVRPTAAALQAAAFLRGSREGA